MATPTGPERKLLAAGFSNKAAGTAWGTADALGANCGLNAKSISGFNRSQDLLIAQEIDQPMPFSGSLDSIKPVDFTITTDMLYAPGALGTGIAMLFGTAGAPAGPADTSAYTHTFQLADGIFGSYGTFAMELPGKIWEAASVKPIEWSLKSSGSGFVTSELKMRGNTLIDTSATNTLTQMDALTYDDKGTMGRVTFKQQKVYMEGQAVATDVIDAGHLLNAMGVEVSVKRTGFDGVVPAGASSILEPAEGGYPDIRVKLNFAHFDAANAAYLAAAIAETPQKMAIRYTGLVLAGAATVYHEITLYFPRLRMLMPEAGYDEIVKNSVEFIAEEATAEPTGMSYHRPYITFVNKRTTDYLTAHA
jgi:hypothetical protein